MPGVPSSRGCEACRKQKKKCDQLEPSCSRCTRLRVPCVGSGQQRYKFIDGIVGLACINSNAAHMQTAPSNHLTVMTSNFLAALGVTDPRFDLTIYGDFMKEIPRRLGSNGALDATVYALTAAFATIPKNQPSAEAINCYGRALKSIRLCLMDPIERKSPDTLCAMYLIMILQGWVGTQSNQYPNHGEAIAQLMNEVGSQNWQGIFETQMTITLCTIVIFESFFNPNVKIIPWMWEYTQTFGPYTTAQANSAIESLKPRNLASIPVMLRDPILNLPKLKTTYGQIWRDCGTVANILSALPNPLFPTNNPRTGLPMHIEQQEARFQTGYGILLAQAIQFNCIIQTLEPRDLCLSEQLLSLIDDVIRLAKRASRYRPLGASSMPLCLVAALAAADHSDKELQLKALLADYQTDFPSTTWLQMVAWLRPRWKRDSYDPKLIQPTAGSLTTIKCIRSAFKP
ncbi:hypothetical protein CC78DRAFT_615971 [Lojkania enalia]|uniref:Zn(2)-C6 fungal-type domain-containing protein n=1 Tax=Lojkania enalia TaxID=147567 RepID=A0A9P4N8L5_9PLEO|nr:hypothetical protein CC78DRAFT_615971 [Didymosphaeria enalia]